MNKKRLTLGVNVGILGSMAKRTAFLVDLDNLVGGTSAYDPQAMQAVAAFLPKLQTGDDHVVLAYCASLVPEVMPYTEFTPYRHLWGRGPDGADHQLLSVIEDERLAARFEEIVLGSGDGIFAPAVAALCAGGTSVVVASRSRCLSTKLRLAAPRWVSLDGLLPSEPARLDPPPAAIARINNAA